LDVTAFSTSIITYIVMENEDVRIRFIFMSSRVKNHQQLT
jgi:hypothetical protein